MSRTSNVTLARARRKAHIRKVLKPTAERPRLCVFRSANHIYAQIIDDGAGHTLVAASTQSPELREYQGHRGNIAAAKKVGALLGQKAKAAGIARVVFDRNGYLFHGRVKALADAAREAGLEF